MDKHVRIAWLLDFYGRLLTPRQRDMLKRYYEEDYSLGEIAHEEDISRQAVHDALQRGESALENLEEEMGLLTRHLELGKALQECRNLINNPDVQWDKVSKTLEDAIDIWEREEEHGV